MAKYVIEDTTLTGIANAIRAKTGSTDPIPVTDMASQIAAITGGGSEETVTTIFEEQTVEGFVDASEVGTGPWIADGIDATSPIVVGETYLVLWDDAEYECVADEMEMDGGVTIPYIGNPSWYGAEDNGLPFLVGYGSPEATGSTAMYSIITDDSGTSHTVGIYQKTVDVPDGYIKPYGELAVTENGTYDVTNYASVSVAVPESDDSGGSVEGIVYVTFMNGNTELCKTACMKGDSTVDPLEDGKIAAPTKEPTVSTVYTYAGGWSLTDGGEANAAALVDVTEDRTVYAVYAESAREYTINFWIAEGELHESLQVAYGETPSPSRAEKNGYYFDSWTPELTAVTGDADYTAVWSEANPWDAVAQAIANGTYKSVYKVGDCVSLDLGDYGVHDMEIVAFDTDEKADGSGKAAITWLSKAAIAVRVMNSTGTNANGWAATEMRTWLQSDVFAALPTEVQSAVVPVNKTYYNYTTKSTRTIEDTVWIPSAGEMCGNNFGTGGCEDSGAEYTSYFTNEASRIKSYNGSADFWWLRSADSGYYNFFRCVYYTGSNTSRNATSSYGVVLGFCT